MITINLHKAQKYTTKLGKEISGHSSAATSRLTIDASDKSTEIFDNMNKFISDQSTKLERYIELVNDLSLLKDAIFKVNIENGNHKIIASLNNKRKLQSVYQSLINNLNYASNLRDPKTITVEFIESKQSILKENGNTSTSVDFMNFQKEDLEDKIKILSKEIDALEDQLASNNISSKIDIQLSDVTLDFLNLA